MSAMGRLAAKYQLTGDEDEAVVESIIDTEVAVREWAMYLDETGRRLQ